MRSFIAIELPQDFKDFLSQIQIRLKSSNADVKWVKKENIHLTLKFLGEVNQEQLKEVIFILESISKTKMRFSLKLNNLGAFPKIDSPKVIWIGLGKGDAQLRELAEELGEKFKKIGFAKEKRDFSSHITLGRLRSGLKRSQLVQELKALTADPPEPPSEFIVQRITLFKSTLTPQGPVYEVIHQANLDNI